MKSTQIFYRLIAIGFLLLPAVPRAEGAYIIGALGPASEFPYSVDRDVGAPEVEGSIGHMWGFGQKFGKRLALELFRAKPAASEATYADGFYLDSSLTTAGLALKLYPYLSDTSRGFFKVGRHSWDNVHKAIGLTSEAEIILEYSGTDLLWGFGAEFQTKGILAVIVGYDSYEVDRYSKNLDHFYFGVKFGF